MAVLGASVSLILATMFLGAGGPFLIVEMLSLAILAVFGIWLILDRRVQVVLDDRGIFDRRLRRSRIPWSHIERAYAQPLGGIDMVWLDVRRDDASSPAQDRVPLRVTGLAISTDELLDLIAKGSVAWQPGKRGI